MTSLIEQQQGEQQPTIIKSVKPHEGFTLDYLDHDQREKILKHLNAGKTLKCHHKNCNSFDEEFSTLYEYNVHCHTRHKRYPLHPELSLIELLGLEPRGNPWENNTCSITVIKSKSYNIEEIIEHGLDFLLSHFNKDRLFPRTITTGKLEGKQVEVFSKQEALSYFEESNFIDCKINAFPSNTRYKEIQRYPPDIIFIDIDRSSFESDKQFENALSKTLKNIKNKLNGYPTVNNSGNGYHIIQPIECPIVLEQIEQFQKYKDKWGFFLSQEFLRFAEDYLSNGKADSGHYPSFKSCQIRVPNSINSKCLDNRDKRLSGGNKVKTIQKWDGIRVPIPREFIEDFRTHLEQKITDQENNYYNNNYKYKNNNNNNSNHHHYYSYYSNNNNNNHIEWIEEKILLYPFPDCRKIIVDLILAPYLINIKKLSYQESFQIIKDWLVDKCNSLKKLDNYSNFVNYRIHHALKTAASKGIGPMSLYRIKNDSRYSNSLYLLILQNTTVSGNVHHTPPLYHSKQQTTTTRGRRMMYR